MKDGKASGIRYVDRATGDRREVVRKGQVVLCASTLESTRLLLNSGICNSSGVLGHHLMDHIYEAGAYGEWEGVEGKPWAGMPSRPNGIYIPRFRNVKEKETNGFMRGYGYQGGASPDFNWGAPGFGASYKDAMRAGVEYLGNVACTMFRGMPVADMRTRWRSTQTRVVRGWHSDFEDQLRMERQREDAVRGWPVASGGDAGGGGV